MKVQVLLLFVSFVALLYMSVLIDGQSTRQRIKDSRNQNKSAALTEANRAIESINEEPLPPGFFEMPPEQIDLDRNATGVAPTPILNVLVLQNGQPIDKEVTVHPGSPLEMVIYLDDKSAQVYGLLTSYLKVQDNTPRQREEVIIVNGCSLDTYIFGNFEHYPEDQSLRAKFRAFKFPESNFVKFTGTVNVCIKQCAEAKCKASRRRRSSGETKSHNGLVLTVSTILRISDK